MAKSVHTGIITASLALAGIMMVNPAAAQSAIDVTVNNNTSSPGSIIEYVPQSCQGTPTPAFDDIIVSGSQDSSIQSPFPTSNGCTIRYRREDNFAYCQWVLSRLRTTPTGPWNPPTVNTSSNGSVTCNHTMGPADPNGDWEVTLNLS